jgi:hypothetical protein
VLAHYTLDVVADRFLSLYRALAVRRGRGTAPALASGSAR